MRAKYKINNVQLAIGPTTITDKLPEGGQFKPPRGKSIIFPGIYEAETGKIVNREENWQWDLIIEGESIYTTLSALTQGSQVVLNTKFGDHINTWDTYSGQVTDCAFELLEGLHFSGSRRAYKCNLSILCYN